MIIKVSGLIIIRRQVGKGMRGTALVHRSLPLEMALGKSSGAGREPGERGGHGGHRGFGFAPSQGRRARQGLCRVSDFVTPKTSGDTSESNPSTSTLGTQVLGGSGDPQELGTALRFHPWCHPVILPLLTTPCRSPDCPVLFDLSMFPEHFAPGFFPFKPGPWPKNSGGEQP